MVPSRQNPYLSSCWEGTLELQTLSQNSYPESGVSGWPDGAALSQQMAEAEAMQLKEEGNQHFQLQDYKAATKSYSQALKLTKDKALLATLYRNRAACGLKTVCGRAGAGRQGCGGSPFLIGIIHPPLSQPSHLDPSGRRRAPPTAFLDPLPDPFLWETHIPSDGS